MAQTLAELKAENAALEAANEEETTTPPQEVEEETEVIPEVEAVEVEAGESGEVAEPNEDGTEDTEAEDWMHSDSPESQADKKFTDGDIGAAKKQLRAKLERKHSSEIDELKAENERLKTNQGPAPVTAKPSRRQFEDADDPDDAYFQALLTWDREQNTAKQAAATTQAEVSRKQQERSVNISQAVDQHYGRAAELAEKSGISAELYQSSDLVLRQAVDSVFPQGGDAITDALIASLGAGSEKVTYNLGINGASRQEFINLLREDPSGIKAGIYLGKQHERLNAPSKRKTNAPKPAAKISGDATANSKTSAAKKKYDAAYKKGDRSAAFNMKREAKKLGVDTKSW